MLHVMSKPHLKKVCSSMAHAGIAVLQQLHKKACTSDALDGAPVFDHAAHQQQQQRHPQILDAGTCRGLAENINDVRTLGSKCASALVSSDCFIDSHSCCARVNRNVEDVCAWKNYWIAMQQAKRGAGAPRSGHLCLLKISAGVYLVWRVVCLLQLLQGPRQQAGRDSPQQMVRAPRAGFQEHSDRPAWHASY